MTNSPTKPVNSKVSGPAPDRPMLELAPRRTTNHTAAQRGAPHFVDNYLGYLLGQANHALFKDFEAAVRAAGLSSLEWRVLATLSGQAPMPVGALAQAVLSQQPTLTKLLQRLMAHGWVRQSNDPSDQRRTLVQITPTGQRKIAPLIRQAQVHEAQVLKHLSAADMARLKDQLRQLVQAR